MFFRQGNHRGIAPTQDQEKRKAYAIRPSEFTIFTFACCPLRKSQGCDRRRALRILGCLSEASSQNSARLTEQTGPAGEIFVGAPFFWVLFLGGQEK